MQARRPLHPEDADTDTVTVCLPDDAEVMVHLGAYDGALSLKQLTETGEPPYEPLEVTRLQRNPNKHGFRWYGSYKLPNPGVARRSRFATTRTRRMTSAA